MFGSSPRIRPFPAHVVCSDHFHKIFETKASSVRCSGVTMPNRTESSVEQGCKGH